MADQHRWFKLWYAALMDPDLNRLPPAHRWAWAALGAFTKAHGTDGRVVVSPSNVALMGALGVTPDDLKRVVSSFPNVRVEEGNIGDGSLTVTWNHWRKYQEDSTTGERMRRYRARAALRSKRRGEGSRGSKKLPPTSVGGSGDPPASVTEPSANGHGPHAPPVVFRIPASVLSALDRAPVLGKVPTLRVPSWWQAELRANPGVDLGAEVLKAEAYLATNPGRAVTNRGRQQFVHNWLRRAERVEP